MLRGGSWLRNLKHTRSAARYRVDPRSRNADIGFRIICAVEKTTPFKVMPIAEAPFVLPREISTSPMPAPADLNPAPQSSQSSWPISFPFLLIPFGLAIILVRFLTRGHNRLSPSVPTTDLPPRPLTQSIRKVADGFWIESSHAAGTPLLLKYLVDENLIEQTLLYQPGPQGQFIFTGSTPGDIDISGAHELTSPFTSRPPPPMSHGKAEPEDQSQPPIFPAAY